MKRKLRRVLAFLCPLVIVAGCDIRMGSWSQARYERTVEKQAPLEIGSKVVARTSSGSVTVTGADVTECSVVAEICGRAPTEEEAQELAEQVEIQLEKVGDTLTVKADKPPTGGKRSISISYEITVPMQTSVDCSSSYGPVTLTDIKGRLTGKTSSGSITAGNIEGPIDLDTSYGPITCKRISDGDIKLKTSSGSIKLLDASFGVCDAHTSYGSINASDVAGNSIKVHSGSGSINVTDVIAETANISTSYGRITCRQITASEITAKSSSGSIDVVCSEATPEDVSASLVTSYGSIDFVGPADFAGQVDISTSYGSVRTDLPITISGQVSKKKLKGTVGSGNGKLYLHTSSGSINIKQRKYSRNTP
ncbi:MAG: DUF4097 family beta strand repeat-containing protein [Planctomycetota bacterium]|jgi:DUF4097 and DUF4098 domain-containing protein YvlB